MKNLVQHGVFASVLALALVACPSPQVPAPTPPAAPPPPPAPTVTSYKIIFERFQVINDCDFGTGAGEFYFTLRVNGSPVATLAQADAAALNDFEYITLGSQYGKTVSVASSGSFTVGGEVYESDAPISETTVGTFLKTLDSGNNFGENSPGKIWVQPLTASTTCGVEIWYSINRV